MPTVVVTWGGRGIGRAIALSFAEPGSTVAIAARTGFQLEDTGAEIRRRGANAVLLALDVTDEGSVSAGFRAPHDVTPRGIKTEVVRAFRPAVNAGLVF
jgi:3-oxoacyl-[acyl-carrier protein] reductase